MSRRLALALLISALSPVASPAAGDNWSEELLGEVLRARAATATEQGRESGLPSEGVVLRSYQPRHLRLGDEGRGRSALALLSKLLPPGSSVKVDGASNTLHLLASPSAQAAAWDFLCTLDLPSETKAVAKEDLSPTLQAVLARLEATQGANARITEELGRLREDIAGQRAETRQAVQQGQSTWLLPALAGGVLLLGGLWLLSKRKESLRQAREGRPTPSPGLSTRELLVPESTGLTAQQKELQTEMMGVINAAAIRMEAWYNEQRQQKEQLTQVVALQENALRDARAAFTEARSQLMTENRALLELAGSRLDKTAEKLEANVSSLGVQNDRVEALAGELHNTVRELDQTKDEILRLQGMLQNKDHELEETRTRLGRREGELTHQQAKLAALTLILEEGGSFLMEQRAVPQAPADADATKESPGEPPSSPRQSARPSEQAEPGSSLQSCIQANPQTNTARIRFQFLPTSHHE